MTYTLELRDTWREAAWTEHFDSLMAAADRVRELEDSSGWVWVLRREDGSVHSEGATT